MNYLLDCGYRYGEALPIFHKKLGCSNNPAWHIHAFEPNPAHQVELYHADVKNITYHRAAAWIADDRRQFHQTPSGQIHDKMGGSSTLADFDPTVPILATVEVPTIDLATFILALPDPERLILKLDVEGAEYAILRHLLATGAARHLTDLYVEFHPSRTGESRSAGLYLLHDYRRNNTNTFRWF